MAAKYIKKLIQKYFLSVDTNGVKPGDLMTKGDNDYPYESIGVYYNYELKPFMFFRDDNGYIYSAPVYECRPAKKAVKSV